MNINNTVHRRCVGIFSSVLRYVFFITLSYILLYPFLFVAVNAFKSYGDASDVTVNWVPKSLYFGNFAYAFKLFDIPKAFFNTVVCEIFSALIEFCSCAVVAYGLARFNLRFKPAMIFLLILTILVPNMMIIIPSYVNFTKMDFLGILSLFNKITGIDIRISILGTPLVFHLPSLLAVGYKGGLFIYIFMQFYKSLPKELEEAAWIDGAGSWKTFLKIIVPSSGSAAITVLLFSVVWHWNEYYLAQMYMEENTLATSINSFTGALAISKLSVNGVMPAVESVQLVTAGCLIFILPLFIYYLVMQKKFISSVATIGIVG